MADQPIINRASSQNVTLSGSNANPRGVHDPYSRQRVFYGGSRGVSANGSRPSRAGRVIGLVRDGWIRGSLTARFRKDFAKGNSPCRGIVWKTQWPVVFDRVTENACKHGPRIDFKFFPIDSSLFFPSHFFYSLFSPISHPRAFL